MLTCTAKLRGIAPLGFSAPVKSVREKKEQPDAFEERTWREKMHIDKDGIVFIPPMALKHVLANAAQFLGEKVRGKGQATYTKHFKSGIMIPEPLSLGIKADTVQSERLFVPSDGKPGGGKRVWKLFPVIPEWTTEATIVIFDDLLIGQPEKVHEYLEFGGVQIGLLFWRPAQNGLWGRFKVDSFSAKDGK